MENARVALERGWARPDWALSVPTFCLAPLVTRETNLKFRQAPMIMHHELTSIRKIASFQGGSWQTHPAPLGSVSLRAPTPPQWEHRFLTCWVEGVVQLLTSRCAHYHLLSCLIYSQTIGAERIFSRQTSSRSISNPLNQCFCGGVSVLIRRHATAFDHVLHFSFNP